MNPNLLFRLDCRSAKHRLEGGPGTSEPTEASVYTKGHLKGSEVVFGLYLTALFDRIVTSIPRTYR
jgi:hypothetical protein